jgi:hypothetical protein
MPATFAEMQNPFARLPLFPAMLQVYDPPEP